MTKINKCKRITLNIPVGTEIHKFLSKNNKQSKWELLDEMIKQFPQTKEDRSVLIFNSFVQQLSELYPEVNGGLEKLRPLVFKHIIKRESLDSWYFEELKKI